MVCNDNHIIQNPYLRNIGFSHVTRTEIPDAAVVVSGAAGVVWAGAVVVTAASVVVSVVVYKSKGFIQYQIC